MVFTGSFDEKSLIFYTSIFVFDETLIQRAFPRWQPIVEPKVFSDWSCCLHVSVGIADICSEGSNIRFVVVGSTLVLQLRTYNRCRVLHIGQTMVRTMLGDYYLTMADTSII